MRAIFDQIRWWGMLALLCAAPARAHLEGTCLLIVADRAESEQACLVTRQEQNACDAASTALASAVRECATQRYIPADIEHAIGHGRERVAGSPAGSPWARAKNREAAAQTALAPMMGHYSQRFGLAWQAFTGMMDDNFDTSVCPGAFEGSAGRYLWLGEYRLRRSETGSRNGHTGPFDWRFVQAMVPGRCYPVPRAGATGAWGDPVILNLPRQMLHELALQRELGKVYICREERDCLAQRDAIMAVYQEYLGLVARHFQLERCSGIAQVNLMPRWVTRKNDDPACPVGTVDATAKEVLARLRTLDDALFISGKLGTGHFSDPSAVP